MNLNLHLHFYNSNWSVFLITEEIELNDSCVFFEVCLKSTTITSILFKLNRSFNMIWKKNFVFHWINGINVDWEIVIHWNWTTFIWFQFSMKTSGNTKLRKKYGIISIIFHNYGRNISDQFCLINWNNESIEYNLLLFQIHWFNTSLFEFPNSSNNFFHFFFIGYFEECLQLNEKTPNINL